jgi:trehalose 6-phosphate synthase
LVNPYDPEGVAMAINRALSMSLEERRQRHAANYRVLAQNDLTRWAERFLNALEGPPGASDLPTLAEAAAH